MNVLESLATMAEFGGKNTAYNLDFIGEEKIGWKPEPGAKSALEIVNHVVSAVRGMIPVARGEAWSHPQFTPATNVQEAKQLLVSSTEEYAAALRQADPEDFGRVITAWDRFTLPVGRALTMPVMDLLHHHGQIAYIQTLLGDNDFHFDPVFVR
jgi:uncharacterized damage-inducible protein DinB